MKSPADHIKDLIEDETDLVFTEDLNVGQEPATPDNCVTLYDTPGAGPLMMLNQSGYEYGGLQVRVRNRSYRDGFEKAYEIQEILHNKTYDKDGVSYELITCDTSPALLGYDDKGRVLVTANYTIQRNTSDFAAE